MGSVQLRKLARSGESARATIGSIPVCCGDVPRGQQQGEKLPQQCGI